MYLVNYKLLGCWKRGKKTNVTLCEMCLLWYTYIVYRDRSLRMLSSALLFLSQTLISSCAVCLTKYDIFALIFSDHSFLG